MLRSTIRTAAPAALLAAGLLAGGSLTLASSEPALASSPNLWATVDAAGNLISSSGVSSTIAYGFGRYEVVFSTPVNTCAYQVSTPSQFSQAVVGYAAGGHTDPTKGVYVEVKNQGGGLTDAAFNLVVTCDQPGTQSAVIGYDANLVRSTPGTSLTALGAGRYQVRFPSKVSSCAFLATVADPGNALVFNPSNVATASGPDANTVYVETKNPGAGLQDGVPFHLSVMCPTSSTRVLVAGSGGLAKRGSKLTASLKTAVGDTTMVTDRGLASCAVVATRGEPTKNVPFFPATVEIVPGPTANSVTIRTRDLLFFGNDGTPADRAVHVAAVC